MNRILNAEQSGPNGPSVPRRLVLGPAQIDDKP